LRYTSSVSAYGKPKVHVLLEGRYRKLVRDLPQTIFYCPVCKGRGKGCQSCEGFGKLTKDSVQELIQRKVLPRYRSRRGKFHGAGREDLDVRMLGGGRPFVFEVVNPKNLIVDLDEIRDAINDYGRARIEVTDFVTVPRKRVAQIKETHSPKVYRSFVVVDKEPTDEALEQVIGRSVEVMQRTPQRVAHRRADKDRLREVTVRSIERADGPAGETCLLIEVVCQHGTYVKEWISGEEGRSRPSLASLLEVDTRCLALDVLDVPGPFPELEGVSAPSFNDALSWPPANGDEDRWDLPTPNSVSVRAADGDAVAAPMATEAGDPAEEQE
jgi:tRNA pseudouridine synthase 10